MVICGNYAPNETVNLIDLIIMGRYTNIIEQIRDLPEPANYFSGVSSAFESLPHDVLVFQRYQVPSPAATIHHRFVIVFCLEASGGVILDECLFLLEPGDGMLIFPHQSHQLVRFEKEAINWLFITFEIEDADTLLPLRNHPISVTPAVGDCLGRIVECYKASLSGRRLAFGDIAPRLCLLLSGLLRQPSRGGLAECADGVVDQADYMRNMVRRVTQYVYGNIGRPIRLAEVARHVSISESHLRRVFRQALGLSLGTFIRHTRINKACGLLHKSELNVTQVAEACGFGSLYAFSSVFSKQVGLSPRAYRRKVRGG